MVVATRIRSTGDDAPRSDERRRYDERVYRRFGKPAPTFTEYPETA